MAYERERILTAPHLSKHFLLRGETIDKEDRNTYTNKEADQK